MKLSSCRTDTDLVEQTSVRSGLAAVNVVLAERMSVPSIHAYSEAAHLLAQVPEEDVGLVGVQGVARGELDAQLLLQGLDHVVPLPRPLEIERVFLPVLALRLVLERCLPAGQRLDHALDQGLRDVHHVVHVRVRHVELADRELGVVREVDALVAEHAPDLVHAVEPADDELLEVQLRRDAEVEVEVEVVVVRDEGLGGRAAGDHARHGRLDLEEPERVHEAADVVDDAAARDENAPGLVGENEVEVALAVAGLLVLEAEVARGQLVEVGREEDHLGGGDGELALLGAGGGADDTDDVAAVEDVVGGDERVRVVVVPVCGVMNASRETAVVSNSLLGGHDLHLVPLAVQIIEAQLLTGGTDVVDAAGQHLDLALELAPRLDQALLAVFVDVRGNRNGYIELVGVGVGVLCLAQLLNLAGAQFKVLLEGGRR